VQRIRVEAQGCEEEGVESSTDVRYGRAGGGGGGGGVGGEGKEIGDDKGTGGL
jgi:hypothetical protein